MLFEFITCEDYDMSNRSIAFAHNESSVITIMPLIGDIHRQCLKFDEQNKSVITYSHHSPPSQSTFMPAAISKRFISFSLDGRYIAISWQPLNLDAELDPSRKSVLIYRTKKFRNAASCNKLSKSLKSDMPHCIIDFHGGCSFLPDGRLALINDHYLRVIELVKHTNGELVAEEKFTVDLQQDLDDDGISRSDFYDDLPGIKDVITADDRVFCEKKKVDPKKIEKTVSFKETSDTAAAEDECKDALKANAISVNEKVSKDELDLATTYNSNDIFYEATDVQDQVLELQNCTADEEEIEIITKNELDSDDDFVHMKNVSTQLMKGINLPNTVYGNKIKEIPAPVDISIAEEGEGSASLESPRTGTPPNSILANKYDNESNAKKIEFIKKHIKTLKQSGAIFITSGQRHNIWKIEKSSIKLFFSISKNTTYRASDKEHVFTISKFDNMVIAASKYSTFNTTVKSDSPTNQLTGSLHVYDTCSGSVVAHLSLPENRKSVNAILQVSFIQKDMYALAVTYHYEKSNHPSKNCYYIDIWDIGSGTHLSGKPFTSEIGYMPDSKFFINESIKLRYGCGAFIRAFPSIPPSINSGCIGKSDDLNSRISSVTAHLIPLFEDQRKKDEIYNGNIRKDFFISAATATTVSSTSEKNSTKERNESPEVFYIWSKAKQPSSSYSKKIPALSFPIYFLDNDTKYIMVVFKNNFNSRISIWRLVSFTAHTSSGPMMTVYEKQVLYSFGNTSANHIERCLGMPSVMFDPSVVLASTSHSLNGKIGHSSSFVVPGNINHSNENQTPVLVISISQKDTNSYRTCSKDTYNNNPDHIEFDYSTDNSSPSPLFYENKRKCCVAIPLLKTSMLECALHAVVNENEQEDNMSKLFYNQVFCRDFQGSTPISKSHILEAFAPQISELFTTVAGTQLLTRLAKDDKHNHFLELIFKYLADDKIYDCHLHTVVSLKKGYSRTHALREALVSHSWENVKSITRYIASNKIMNGTNYYLLERYQYFVDQVVE